jgi:hypothetical protein
VLEEDPAIEATMSAQLHLVGSFDGFAVELGEKLITRLWKVPMHRSWT